MLEELSNFTAELSTKFNRLNVYFATKSELSDADNNLRSEISSLQTIDNELNSLISTLRDDLNTLSSNTSEFDNSLIREISGELSGQISYLSGVIDNLPTIDTSLIESVSGELTNRIDDLTNTVNELPIFDESIIENVTGELKNNINYVSSFVSSLHNYDDSTLTGDIRFLSGRIDDIELNEGLKYSEYDERLSGVEEDVERILEYDFDFDSELIKDVSGELTGQISYLSGVIDHIPIYDENVIRNVSGKLNEHIGNISSFVSGLYNYDDSILTGNVKFLSGKIDDILLNNGIKDSEYTANIEYISGFVSGFHNYDDSELTSKVSGIETLLEQFALSSDVLTSFNAVNDDIYELYQSIENIKTSGYDDTPLRNKISDIEDILSGTSAQFALSSDVLTSYNLTDQRLSAIETSITSFLTSEDIESFLSEEFDPEFAKVSADFIKYSILSSLTGQFALSSDLSGEFSSIHDTIAQIQANGYDDSKLTGQIEYLSGAIDEVSGVISGEISSQINYISGVVEQLALNSYDDRELRGRVETLESYHIEDFTDLLTSVNDLSGKIKNL